MLSTTLSPLVEKLSTLLSAHPDHPVLVALDGRCGSGKTTMAAALAERFPDSIVLHTDDFSASINRNLSPVGGDGLRHADAFEVLKSLDLLVVAAHKEHALD